MHFKLRSALAVALPLLAVVGFTAAPAGAVAVPPETGAGVTLSGSFNSYGQADTSPLQPLPLCITNTTDAVLTLNNTGTFSAGLGNVVVGATTATVTIAAGALHFNPVGTFADASCTVPAVGPAPLGIPASLLVTNSAGTVSCHGAATYTRAVEAATVLAVNASCTVNGVTTSPTLIQFTGSEQPCFPDGPPPVDPCGLVPEWVGVYSQT